MQEVPGSIPSQGPRHTKDVIKMVPVMPLFSTHLKGKYSFSRIKIGQKKEWIKSEMKILWSWRNYCETLPLHSSSMQALFTCINWKLVFINRDSFSHLDKQAKEGRKDLQIQTNLYAPHPPNKHTLTINHHKCQQTNGRQEYVQM